MRLIDADELKKCKVYSEERHEYIVAVFNIDNAPTVVPEDFMNPYDEGYRAGTLDALANLKTDAGLQESSNLFCPRCHVATVFRDVLTINYCPNCGAKMKGAEE